jgi:hypothetical protein
MRLRGVHLVDNWRILVSGTKGWDDWHILAYSSTIFFFARSSTSSSIVSLLTKRYTLTCDFCPIRCARAIACRSFCGFQSLWTTDNNR